MFDIVRVDSQQAKSLEQLGTKRKFWYRVGDGPRMLFKAEERGTGEDWAEKIASELCALLGLPHVTYEMALETATNTPGVVCESCAPPNTSLVHGNQLLLARDSSYPTAKRYKVSEHTIDAVALALAELTPPLSQWTARLPANVSSALDVFAGYVMLDAWIANQDRHHENWGALQDGSGGATLALAPTFDHGASLARNLNDEERETRLTTKDAGQTVEAFVRRTSSAFYADANQKRAMGTVAAWRAFADLTPTAASAWLGCLEAIDLSAVDAVLARVPPSRMSQISRSFTVRLLKINRERLLNGDIE